MATAEKLCNWRPPGCRARASRRRRTRCCSSATWWTAVALNMSESTPGLHKDMIACSTMPRLENDGHIVAQCQVHAGHIAPRVHVILLVGPTCALAMHMSMASAKDWLLISPRCFQSP